MQSNDEACVRLKAQALDIRNKLLSEQQLDYYREVQPHAYRGLIRMDYEDAVNIAVLLPSEMKNVLLEQLDEAYRRAQKYYGE